MEKSNGEKYKNLELPLLMQGVLFLIQQKF